MLSEVKRLEGAIIEITEMLDNIIQDYAYSHQDPRLLYKDLTGFLKDIDKEYTTKIANNKEGIDFNCRYERIMLDYKTENDAVAHIEEMASKGWAKHLGFFCNGDGDYPYSVEYLKEE